MKRHLNTLFVTTEGAYLAKQGQAVAVRVERKTRLRVPLLNLDGIVCFGRVACSPALMAACAEGGVTISLMSEYGRFRAAVVGYSPGNVLLRRQQYRWADDPTRSVAVARNIVAAKIANTRTTVLRAARETRNPTSRTRLDRAAKIMARQVDSARQAENLDSLRGIEGESANTYFGAFDCLINASGDDFRFQSRSRRPPLDPVNSMLSFLYSMLAHDARSACESVGLDAAVGFLHRDRPGRPGLALDLMEEFRPLLADRVVLALVNRRQVRASDFRQTESGAVMMSDEARKTVLATYQKRKQDIVTHAFLGEKTSVGLLIHLQARLLARHLRGDLDTYPPFLWK
jgi:CRISPR-associated protein Cas1